MITTNDVLFLSNVLEKVSNKVDNLGVSGALRFVAMELRVGAKEWNNGELKSVTTKHLEEGKIRGDRK